MLPPYRPDIRGCVVRVLHTPGVPRGNPNNSGIKNGFNSGYFDRLSRLVEYLQMPVSQVSGESAYHEET